MRSLRLGLACALSGSAWGVFRDTAAYTFEEYQHEFNRVYTEAELPMRVKLFAERLAETNAHNKAYAAGEHTWYMAMNRFSDHSHAEMQQFMMKPLRRKKSWVKTNPVFMTQTSDEPVPVPEERDWRIEGALSPIKDQGGCGSCWAFAATETIESHYKIHVAPSSSVPVLAPQAFVNCVENPDKCGGSGGCQGATQEMAFAYAMEHGVPLEQDMEYKGHEDKCEVYQSHVTISNFVHLQHNDKDAFKRALGTKGPLAVAVAADRWYTYGGGDFKGGCWEKFGVQLESCTLNHAVVAVGYTTTHWIVRNSWGEHWGEGGCIYLSRTDDNEQFKDRDTASGMDCQNEDGSYPAEDIVQGESGVLFDASYPVFDTSTPVSVFMV